MRGTRPQTAKNDGRARIIPAHAGNSVAAMVMMARNSDHPRACGELSRTPDVPPSAVGSSPRMRGTPARPGAVRRGVRIIPAHAGNSELPCMVASRAADHPRACGELQRDIVRENRHAGSSPRMRGTPSERLLGDRRRRIIPAHAGNSHRPREPARFKPDHPRACGELQLSFLPADLDAGSSPRMRGTPQEAENAQALRRIIPAHAGNSASPRMSPSRTSDHPRACGELSANVTLRKPVSGSSPRMRGTCP